MINQYWICEVPHFQATLTQGLSMISFSKSLSFSLGVLLPPSEKLRFILMEQGSGVCFGIYELQLIKRSTNVTS